MLGVLTLVPSADYFLARRAVARGWLGLVISGADNALHDALQLCRRTTRLWAVLPSSA